MPATTRGTAVLIVASSYHSTEAAAALVEAGAEVKVADRRGNTPLHTAAQMGDLELVKKLLAKGNDCARSRLLSSLRRDWTRSESGAR